MKVADYKELRVYKLAFDSAMEIFRLSKKFPAEERYSLTDQVRRSSRSVCANISEAWRKRRYEAAFISKLSDSDTEAAETEVHLDFALECGYIDHQQHAILRDHYDHVCSQLAIMMADAASWCTASDRVRETCGEYFIDAPDAQTLPRS
jgi:four helix bundle protein